MPLEPVIDIDALAAPLGDESPTGEPLDRTLADGDFMRVKDARDAAGVIEKARLMAAIAGDSPDEAGQPDWRAVAAEAQRVLSEVSKDLRVAGWLAESLLYQHRFVGVRDGLALVRRLCEQHWEQLHPAPDEDSGHGDAVAPLTGLCGDLAETQLNTAPLTPEIDGLAYSLSDFQQATGTGQLTSVDFTEADLRMAAASASPEFYPDLLECLTQASEDANFLSSFLTDNCRPDEYDDPTAPPIHRLRDRLEEALRVARGLAGDAPLVEEEEGADGEAGEGAPAAGGGVTGPIASREQAFKALTRVAEYFDKHEPHSPIPYAVRQVISWGKMSLPDLLAELINDDSVKTDLRRRVGVPIREENEEGF